MRFLIGVLCAGLLAACGGSEGDAIVAGWANQQKPAAVSLHAGSLQRAGSLDGVRAAAQFNSPEGVAVDRAGNILVADRDNHAIRKLAPDGKVSTLAGAAGQAGSVDGAGEAARFSSPRGVAVDAAGNVFVADTGNLTVRRISTAGVVSTLAGSAGQGGTTDGAGAAARFSQPSDVAVDASGTLFVADGALVRRITPAGVVSTFAEALSGFPAVTGVAVDAAGNVYVARTAADVLTDADGSVRKYDSQGRALSLGAGGEAGVTVVLPQGIATDAAGDVIVASAGSSETVPGRVDVFSSVLRISAAGTVTTVAGRTNAVGGADGPRTSATFQNPLGVAVDAAGRILVADTGNHAIRQVGTGTVSTLAGGAGSGFVDGVGPNARFFSPTGLAAQPDGALVVADSGNHAVRRISPAGNVSTISVIAPAGTERFSLAPAGVALAPDGTVLVAETATPSGRNVYAIDNAGRAVLLDSASGGSGIAVDRAGAVYLTEGSQVVAIPRSGTKRVVASGFRQAAALAVNAAGTLYVADAGDHTIRTIGPSGVVSLLAGRAGEAGYRDGSAQDALFDVPRALALDESGTVYVADNSNTIRKIAPDGRVSTLAGAAGASGAQLGPLPSVLGRVEGLAWAAGTLFATIQNAVLKIGPVN